MLCPPHQILMKGKKICIKHVMLPHQNFLGFLLMKGYNVYKTCYDPSSELHLQGNSDEGPNICLLLRL